MLKTVKNYIKDEKAIDDSVMKIIFVVLAIAIVIALGWFVWNKVSDRAGVASDKIDNNSNPGAGHEFGGSPFD